MASKFKSPAHSSVDWNEVVVCAHLEAMASVEQREIALIKLGAELPDSVDHMVGQSKPSITSKPSFFRSCARSVASLACLGNRLAKQVLAIADHERDAYFGSSRITSLQSAVGKS